MADVAIDEAKIVRGRLLQWEAGERPLAALSSNHQDTLFLLMEAAAQRPYPPQVHCTFATKPHCLLFVLILIYQKILKHIPYIYVLYTFIFRFNFLIEYVHVALQFYYI